MGAIDLVVQIEAPPSVASGLQRIGRAGHQAGAVSEGIIFPKFRGDLVACAAVARAMHEGRVESTRYPRNPLDVLAQQIVAMAALDTWSVDELFALIRRAAPFADLSRRTFEGVLDMLSGRYPSDEFAELRPRITWDRLQGRITGRAGAKRVAIANAGTIPDRGLYGVFLAGADRPTRVGELDEEMVFETAGRRDVHARRVDLARRGDHARPRARLARAGRAGQDAVLARRSGRPSGGARVRDRQARTRAARRAGGDGRRAAGARSTISMRRRPTTCFATSTIRPRPARSPTTARIVIERCLDELGDWRVCLLSPLGSRIHAPWAMAATAQIRSRTGIDVEVMWGDEGFVVRFPGSRAARRIPSLLLPDAGEVEGLVLRQLGSTSLFAARFRETAARALLLPRRRPGMRTPLWQQRKRAADLLAVAVALRIVSGAARNLSRGAARSLRHAGARRHAAPAVGAHAAPDDDRFEGAVAVRRVAALQLRRQLHLRRRRAARRAARAGAVGGSGAAARAARRRGAARAARSRRARSGRAAAAASRPVVSACDRPTACTTC